MRSASSLFLSILSDRRYEGLSESLRLFWSFRYSTVTDLARLRGRSMSQPRKAAAS